MITEARCSEGAVSAVKCSVKALQKGESLWRKVQTSRPELIARMSDTPPTTESEEEEAPEDYYKDSIAAYVASILSFPEAEKWGLLQDLQIIKNAVGSIREASNSGILTEDEGNAVATFLFSRFIQRRFDETLKTVLAPEKAERKAHLMWASGVVHGRPAKAY
jgi:hypothetical protein